MTTIYLIRHAEADGNLYRRAHGWYDSVITDRGYRQIAALAKRFASTRFDAVYSSDRRRTMTTALSVYKTHGLPLVTTPRVREIGIGVWEDHPWAELERTDGEQLERFNTDAAHWHVAGGEYLPDVRERMIGALREQLMLRFVFSVPGMPCIYYGDEAGVEGCADPFCRRTYPWGREDQDMLARYKAMAAMRNGHPVLKTGECAYIAPCSAVLGVIRKNENGKDAFGKKAENACAVTLINRSAREVVVYLTSADVSGAQTLVSDDGQIFTARSGAFSVKIKGLQGMTIFAM